MPGHDRRPSLPEAHGVELRIRGLVQGVGFRPTVFRYATERGIVGEVGNDGDAVVIRGWGSSEALRAFVHDVRSRPPVLARIDEVVELSLQQRAPTRFSIVASTQGTIATAVLPDAATCAACLSETLARSSRRYRYPLTNCTECGPRYSIVRALPYDRKHTSMAAFELCDDCRVEYEAAGDRRFHAQPNACPVCGPSVRLLRLDGTAVAVAGERDACDAAGALLQRGEIVAIKGVGGYHLACDATNDAVLARLRERKQRPRKALALMARDVETIARYCEVSPAAEVVLRSPAAPIVLLPARGELEVAAAVAPGLRELGFMLPSTPLHHLVLRGVDVPVVMTSGNRAEMPPCIDDLDAQQRLRGIADWALVHERAIVNRVDDSLVRIVDGRPRCLRRARGYAPAPMRLPAGFASAPAVLAFGTQLKNTFCLLQRGEAVLSPHIGDLADARAQADYDAQLERLPQLCRHTAQIVACDRHPDYVASVRAREHAASHELPIHTVQHHHAHVAACLVEHGRGLHEPPVLGVALDGIGLGDDDALWGGEFLRADYRGFARVGTFKRVRLLGGDAASREPWRNLYAHLVGELGWAQLQSSYGELEVIRWLAQRPTRALDVMLERGIASPFASSCGRLFDAVAAAVGIGRERVSFEGEAAIELEANVDEGALRGDGYPFAILDLRGLPYVEPLPMWRALLDDLGRCTKVGIIAARFHRGLAAAIASMVRRVIADGDEKTVVLTGGVFDNAVLHRLVDAALRDDHRVLTHARIPANDGGVSLGQAVVAAAQSLDRGELRCV